MPTPSDEVGKPVCSVINAHRRLFRLHAELTQACTAVSFGGRTKATLLRRKQDGAPYHDVALRRPQFVLVLRDMLAKLDKYLHGHGAFLKQA